MTSVDRQSYSHTGIRGDNSRGSLSDLGSFIERFIDIISVILVSIKIKVRATSETVVGDAEIQHQRHRARRVRKVGHQLNIPTMSTPAFSNVVRLGFMRCTEKVTASYSTAQS